MQRQTFNGKAIRRFKQESGINRTRFAAQLGISTSYLDQIQAGRIPGELVLKKIARRIGCKPTEMIVSKRR